jgi:hypothetical protein
MEKLRNGARVYGDVQGLLEGSPCPVDCTKSCVGGRCGLFHRGAVETANIGRTVPVMQLRCGHPAARDGGSLGAVRSWTKAISDLPPAPPQIAEFQRQELALAKEAA